MKVKKVITRKCCKTLDNPISQMTLINVEDTRDYVIKSYHCNSCNEIHLIGSLKNYKNYNHKYLRRFNY